MFLNLGYKTAWQHGFAKSHDHVVEDERLWMLPIKILLRAHVFKQKGIS
jgi:hypothetical protein